MLMEGEEEELDEDEEEARNVKARILESQRDGVPHQFHGPYL